MCMSCSMWPGMLAGTARMRADAGTRACRAEQQHLPHLTHTTHTKHTLHMPHTPSLIPHATPCRASRQGWRAGVSAPRPAATAASAPWSHTPATAPGAASPQGSSDGLAVRARGQRRRPAQGQAWALSPPRQVRLHCCCALLLVACTRHAGAYCSCMTRADQWVALPIAAVRVRSSRPVDAGSSHQHG
jgi:hypothetical protein